MDAELRASTPERDWWLRVLAVFQAPRAVFAGLRDDSDEQATARQEPVLALVILAGMGAILVTNATGSLLDNPEVDRLIVLVLVFLGGALYGTAAYWIGGGALYLGVKAAGGDETYRRARHLLAFAAGPIALSLLVLWPLQIAIYGERSLSLRWWRRGDGRLGLPRARDRILRVGARSHRLRDPGRPRMAPRPLARGAGACGSRPRRTRDRPLVDLVLVFQRRNLGLEAGELLLRDRVGVLLAREGAGPNVADEALEGGTDLRRDLGVALGESR